MTYSERILITDKDGTAIYGRIIDFKTRKLGRYEVIHNKWGNNGTIYHTYSEAEKRMNALSTGN